MAKYARVNSGYLTDVHTVPGSYPDSATRDRCLPGGGFVEIPDNAEHGAKVNGDGTYTNPTIPTPSVVLKWDAFDFKKRFTAAERIAIRAAAASSGEVYDFLDMLDTAGMTGTMIKADDVLLNAALDLMSAGESPLLGPGRKDEILGS